MPCQVYFPTVLMHKFYFNCSANMLQKFHPHKLAILTAFYFNWKGIYLDFTCFKWNDVKYICIRIKFQKWSCGEIGTKKELQLVRLWHFLLSHIYTMLNEGSNDMAVCWENFWKCGQNKLIFVFFSTSASITCLLIDVYLGSDFHHHRLASSLVPCVLLC